MLLCNAYHKTGAVIWYVNGIERYILSLVDQKNRTQEYNTRCLTPDFANLCLTLDVSAMNSKEIHTYTYIILYMKNAKYQHFSMFIKSWGWGENKSFCISHRFTLSSLLMQRKHRNFQAYSIDWICIQLFESQHDNRKDNNKESNPRVFLRLNCRWK